MERGLPPQHESTRSSSSHRHHIRRRKQKHLENLPITFPDNVNKSFNVSSDPRTSKVLLDIPKYQNQSGASLVDLMVQGKVDDPIARVTTGRPTIVIYPTSKFICKQHDSLRFFWSWQCRPNKENSLRKRVHPNFSQVVAISTQKIVFFQSQKSCDGIKMQDSQRPGKTLRPFVLLLRWGIRFQGRRLDLKSPLLQGSAYPSDSISGDCLTSPVILVLQLGMMQRCALAQSLTASTSVWVSRSPFFMPWK